MTIQDPGSRQCILLCPSVLTLIIFARRVHREVEHKPSSHPHNNSRPIHHKKLHRKSSMVSYWVLSRLMIGLVLREGRSFSAAFTRAACRRSCDSTVSWTRLYGATRTDGSSDSLTTTTTKQQSSKGKSTEQLSIAVVGSGAVGCYYGARLWEQGHDVRFLFRGENYEAVRQQGLNVTSVYGDMYLPPDRLQAYDDTAAMAEDAASSQRGGVDWVLVALKSTALDAIPNLIFPLLDAKTRILVIMNGFIEDDLIRMLKERSGQTVDSDNDDVEPLDCCQALYGGMALVCSNKLGPGVVDHSYAGLLTAGVASSQTSSEHDKTAFFDLFQNVKSVDVAFEPSLLRGRWKKMVWNLPFNGISVAMGGITIDRVVQDPSLRQLAYQVMDETIAAANADLEALYGPENYEPLGDEAKKQMMDLSDGMGEYSTSTKLDLVNRRPMEVKYMFRKAVERAQKVGVPVGHLETLVAQIEAYQRHYGLF